MYGLAQADLGDFRPFPAIRAQSIGSGLVNFSTMIRTRRPESSGSVKSTYIPPEDFFQPFGTLTDTPRSAKVCVWNAGSAGVVSLGAVCAGGV